ncbi:MAG: NYN domain-containing protein [Chloroflexi bacterium]|nr:NYN domain-containing protein [Chloroflexota bacterium]
MYKPPNNYAFIDGSNLHITYEYIDWKMDYRKLLRFLRKRYNITIAYYFVGYVLKFSDIYKKLEEYGYVLKHEVANDLDAYLIKQAKWDINKYDGAVIISSDQHFAELVEYLDSKDKLKLVLAPCNKGCSGKLKKAANTKIEFLSNFKKELKKDEG